MQLILDDISVREIQAVGYALREPEKVIALSGDTNMGKIPVPLGNEEQEPDEAVAMILDPFSRFIDLLLNTKHPC